MLQGEVQLQPRDSQKRSDLESGSPASSHCCRICLEENNSSGDEELISPCMCKGTQKFVHRSCLDRWRSVKGGFAFSNCTTCNAQLHFPDEQPFDDINNSWRQRLIDAWWVFLMFLILQPPIAAGAGGAYMMDTDGDFRNSFKNELVRILAKHPILFYYSIGFVSFFGMFGFTLLIAQFIARVYMALVS
ncbi:unnamed protein product [Eruca vesicaria subsp. sativa]|uniref:RING-CH-type domain-containing protein n=1 Tax=Eruca vesicaria subsp. sativa TaxID=29727 RepID=A0ABC8L6L6_ERUVS|nr:unnamed protein product [Eruca vesicaria subsp. sativa]